MSEPEIADPVSWQLVEFLAGRVRLITKAAGYRTDIGLGVVVIDDADVPPDHQGATTVIEVDRISATSAGRAQASSDVGIVIEFSVPRGGDESNPRRLVHLARADLRKALMFDSRDLPKGVTTFDVSEANLATVSDGVGHSSVVAQITARAGLTELF
ncbi:hypothetical protein [Stenotrophomonas sp. 364]|uniref:hypothetical protein n=1 Tax=Stenotrophomonas sp. 364 TaxID=2691571 RepID=UPI0013180D3D|nr:hypothetical protein [Stenotrophomonas sp. 364]QHB72092.1 hypothetical protein GQ674_12690 [Stenotrophomonas sp. 364]